MKKGANATVTVVSIVNPQKPIELILPLTGFTAAFDSIPAPVK
jgi:invasion protein IalB